MRRERKTISDIQEVGVSGNRYFLIIKSHFVHFSDARIEFLKACGCIIPAVGQISVSHLLQQLHVLGMLILNKKLDEYDFFHLFHGETRSLNCVSWNVK